MVPEEYLTCPGCGLLYGHHNTKVDAVSEECSFCVAKMKYKNTHFVTAAEFINRMYPGADGQKIYKGV